MGQDLLEENIAIARKSIVFAVWLLFASVTIVGAHTSASAPLPTRGIPDFALLYKKVRPSVVVINCGGDGTQLSRRKDGVYQW